jgi:hypothetical protein
MLFPESKVVLKNVVNEEARQQENECENDCPVFRSNAAHVSASAGQRQLWVTSLASLPARERQKQPSGVSARTKIARPRV